MNRKPIAALIAASSLVAFAGIAQAQSSSHPASDTSRSASGVEYTTGGIGLMERQELTSEASQFNTHLEFVYAPEGEYLAGVHVEISNARGDTVLSTTTDGPWLLAKLPSGHYTVKASFGGVTRTHDINVGGGKRHMVMRFPASVGAQDIAGSSTHTPSMAYTR